MGNVNMEARQINDRTKAGKHQSVADHLKALDAIAASMEGLPTFTSNDRAFLEGLPAFPTEDGTKVLTATTSEGSTNLSYEEMRSGSVDYSTNEVNTGIKWIDGKYIHRKVIELGALPNATTKNVPHGITNVSKWIAIVATANTSSHTGMSIPLVYDGNNAINNTRLAVNDTNVVMETDTDRSSFNDCNAILFYTKTT